MNSMQMFVNSPIFNCKELLSKSREDINSHPYEQMWDCDGKLALFPGSYQAFVACSTEVTKASVVAVEPGLMANPIIGCW